MENGELIRKALNYVKSEYKNSELTVDSVADHAGFNADYFNRIFAAHTGFHVMEYARFLRLRQASLILRTTEKSILDIALACGYDSHESFSRAFKGQYGKTPGEYRKTMKSVEPLYGEFHNETIGASIVHEFPLLKIVNTDDAIDYLLEKDAIKYGYIAVCFVVNGGVALCEGTDLKDGFVWAWELSGKYQIEVIAEDYDRIAAYCKLFDTDRFDIYLYTLDDEKTVLDELEKRGVKFENNESANRTLCCFKPAFVSYVTEVTTPQTPKKKHGHKFESVNFTAYQTVYRGKKYDLTPPCGIVVRELTISDYDQIERYYFEKEGPPANWRKGFLTHLQYDLKCKYEYGNKNHSAFVFGVFKDDRMVGISLGCLQSAHGFVLNNCIDTSFFEEYATDEMYQYVFRFVTNAAIDAGALPFDDIQNDAGNRKKGNFNSVDMGYEIVQKCYVLK